MAFGHNSNVTYNETGYHVQTEDRGPNHPFIDTTVYCHGQVVHRRTNSYYDLIPLTPQHETVLRQRVETQHRGIVEEIRSGALQLAPPPDPVTPVKVRAPIHDERQAWELQLDLLNPRNWLTANRAHLELAVHIKGMAAAVSGARVTARIEGAAAPTEFSATTGPDGNATLDFIMPRLAKPDAALVIHATQGAASAQLRYQLRARPKAPFNAEAR